MKKIVLLSLQIIILSLSCSDVSDLLFDPEQSIIINTIDNGTLIRGGESLNFSILFDSEIIPDLYSVVIIDNNGVTWGEAEFEIPFSEEEYFSSVIIPDELPPGKYHFHIRVFEDKQEITYKEITLFKVDNNYSIDLLHSIPYETMAGKEVIVKADISSAESADLFLRWRLNGNILSEGFLSEGSDTLYWIAEEENGFYEIVLELFPEFCDTSLKSSIYASTEIIVSDIPNSEINCLEPEDEYSFLMHFSGDLNATEEDLFAISTFGDLQPDYFNGIYGYSLSHNSGLSVIGDVFPVDAEKLTPFTINGRFGSFGEQKSGNILALIVGDETFLSLVVNDGNNLVFSINGKSSKSKFSFFETADISLSVIPDEVGVGVKWFINGINGGTDYIDSPSPLLPEEYEVLVGGNEDIIGADLFIDELGIYIGSNLQSTIDEKQFLRVKKYILGNSLIYAEGFDGLTLSEDFKSFDEELEVENGNLAILPGKTILLKEFKKPIISTEFILSFSENENENETGKVDDWTLYLSNDAGDVLVDFTKFDTTYVTALETGLISREIRFSLVINGDYYDILLDDEILVEEAYRIDQEEFLSLYLETDINSAETSFLDYIMIYSITGANFSEKMEIVLEDENLL